MSIRDNLRTITITVVLSLVLNVPLLIEAFKLLVTYMMADHSGNFVIQVPWSIMVREVGPWREKQNAKGKTWTASGSALRHHDRDGRRRQPPRPLSAQ